MDHSGFHDENSNLFASTFAFGGRSLTAPREPLKMPLMRVVDLDCG
jgi:hypothetical protein